jgi:hypothetical protein
MPVWLQRGVNEQTTDAVRAISDDNPHLTFKQIRVILGSSSPTIKSIIHDHLNLRKVCPRCVSHELTDV